MFTQLIFGFYFIVKGIVEHYSRRQSIFISEITIQNISKEDLPSYLNKVGKTHIILGILIVVMGQIEYKYNPELSIFITSYIILGISCVSRIFYLNKKYSGNYIFRPELFIAN